MTIKMLQDFVLKDYCDYFIKPLFNLLKLNKTDGTK